MSKLWDFLGIRKGGEVSMFRGKNNPKTNAVQDQLQRMHDTIAKKAFELYEKRNCQNGHDLEDWLHAERLVRRSFRRNNT